MYNTFKDPIPNRVWKSKASKRQTFPVKVHFVYELPRFSPEWDSYEHGADNATVVAVTGSGQKITVYSAAQLVLLYQSMFATRLKQEANHTFTINDTEFRLTAKRFNTLLSTYPSCYSFKLAELPDIANISGYWNVVDSTVNVVPLYTNYPAGSYNSDGELLDDIQIDPELVKLAAKAWGIAEELASAYTSMSQVKEYLVSQGRWPQEETTDDEAAEKYRFDNVVFPPVVLVDPKYFQYPLTAYNGSRSPLAALTDLTDKITIDKLSVITTNCAGTPYGVIVVPGVFDSPTVDIKTSLDAYQNNGNWGVHILEKADSACNLYTSTPKEIDTTDMRKQYNLSPASNSFGYNIVIAAEIKWQNWMNNLQSSEILNSNVEVWKTDIYFEAIADCQYSVLNQLSEQQSTINDLLVTIMGLQSGGSTPTPGPDPPGPDPPGPDPPGPDPPGPDPPTEETESLGQPGNNQAELGTIGEDGTFTPAGNNVKLMARVSKNRVRLQKARAGGKGGVNYGKTSLYNGIDKATYSTLGDKAILPLQQAVSFSAVANMLRDGKMTSLFMAAAGLDSDGETTPTLDLTLVNAQLSIPLCTLGMNCYSRGGACQRKMASEETVALSTWQVDSNLGQKSQIKANFVIDEVIANNGLVINGNNIPALMESLTAEGGDGTVYQTQQILSDPDAPAEMVEPLGEPVAEDAISHKAKGAWWNTAAKCLVGVASAFVSEEKDGKLINMISKNRTNTTFFAGPIQIQMINKSSLRARRGKGIKTVTTISSQVGIDSTFKGSPNIKRNELDAWPQDIQEFIQNEHKELLDFGYMVDTSIKGDYTPASAVLEKSQILNFGIGIGSNAGQVGVAQNFRPDNQISSDCFSVSTNIRCVVILSTVPLENPHFHEVAVLCNSPSDFLIAPPEAKQFQPSAANGSDSANYYGSFRYDNKNFYLFNNAHIAAVNDLSGKVNYTTPSQVPVYNETTEQVELKDTVEYVNGGGCLYVNTYSMTTVGVSVELLSGINHLNGTNNEIALIIYNVPASQGDEGLVKEFQMPAISSMENGKVYNCNESVQGETLPIMTRYFYAITDRSAIPSVSVPSTSVMEQPVTKKGRDKSKGKKITPKKKARAASVGRTQIKGYALCHKLERKLPNHYKIHLIRTGK